MTEHNMNQILSYVPMVIESSSRGEKSFDIFSRLLRERIIFLGEEIDDEMAKKNQEKIEAAKKAEEERLAAGIIVANGDAENPEMATIFFGAKGNADVTRVNEGQNFVWKVTAPTAKVLREKWWRSWDM